MNYLVFDGVSGMTLPYNVWGCDYYGNNCVLLSTITTPVPPQTLIPLPPHFDTYPSIKVKITNCINCDYSEFIVCINFLPQTKQFQDGGDFYFQDNVIYSFQT